MKQTRSQKKGAGNQTYARNFLKKKTKLTSYGVAHFEEKDIKNLYVHNLESSNLGGAVLMKIRCKTNSNIELINVAPTRISEKSYLNDENDKFSPILKPLKQFDVGSIVCGIEFHKNRPKFYCSSAGSFAVIAQHDEVKNLTKVKLKGKRDSRFIYICSDNLALKGSASNGGRKLKPFMKAGDKFHLKRSKGQKYPTPSCLSMNVHQHPLGGKSKRRKGMQTSTSHHTSPGAKFGSFSPKRNGKSK